MVTAATSASVEVAEDLMSYFVDIGNKECFASTLFICFDLLRTDIVEELSWQHGLNDFYMPYKIQKTRSMSEKVKLVTLRASDPLTRNNSLLRSRRRSRSTHKRRHKRSNKKRRRP